MKAKLLRVTTIPLSLKVLLRGQLRFMTQHFHVVAATASGKEVSAVEEIEGVKVRTVEMSRQITPVADIKALLHFYRLCKKENPLIVHSHTPKAGIVGMLGAWLAGVPIRMHTVAGLPLMEATGKKRRLLNQVEKLTYRFATDVYPNSKGLHDFILQEKLTTASKLKIIANGSSNGIDTTHFSPEAIEEATKTALRASLGLKDDDFVFIFVGRLVGDKGINELVSAFWQIRESANPRIRKDIKLLLVGPLETDLDPLLPWTLREIETNPDIISLGFQKEVRPYFAISDALVFPSYREGFPNVVMQAGAMGLPSIVTDINGCNEIIEEGKNGLIIPAKDEKAVLKEMIRLAADEQLYNRLQENARPMITSRYEQQMVWDALLKEYQSLIAENERNSGAMEHL